MALLNKLKSLLGFDDAPDDDRQGTDTVGVTVERDHETTDPNAEAEAPPTPAPGSDAAEPDPVSEHESADTGTDAGSGTPGIDPEVETPDADEHDSRGEPPEESVGEPAVDAEGSEPVETTGIESAAEAETGGPVTEADHAAEEREAESKTGSDADPVGEADGGSDGGSLAAEADEGTGSIREIKGIGPSYETKLSEAGIDSPAELAAADASELSGATGLSEKRIQGWIDRAENR